MLSMTANGSANNDATLPGELHPWKSSNEPQFPVENDEMYSTLRSSRFGSTLSHSSSISRVESFKIMKSFEKDKTPFLDIKTTIQQLSDGNDPSICHDYSVPELVKRIDKDLLSNKNPNAISQTLDSLSNLVCLDEAKNVVSKTEDLVRNVIKILESSKLPSQKTASAVILTNLTYDHNAGRDIVIKLNATPHLIKKSKDPEMRLNCLSALMNLTCSTEGRVQFQQHRGIDELLDWLDSIEEVQIKAAAIICNLTASNDQGYNNKSIIEEILVIHQKTFSKSIVAKLISIVSTWNMNPELEKSCLEALINIAVTIRGKTQIIDCGYLKVFQNYLKNNLDITTETLSALCAILVNLLELNPYCQKRLLELEIIPLILNIVVVDKFYNARGDILNLLINAIANNRMAQLTALSHNLIELSLNLMLSTEDATIKANCIECLINMEDCLSYIKETRPKVYLNVLKVLKDQREETYGVVKENCTTALEIWQQVLN